MSKYGSTKLAINIMISLWGFSVVQIITFLKVELRLLDCFWIGRCGLNADFGRAKH